MQLRIQSLIPAPDLARVEAALADADPASVVDFDVPQATLRLSTVLDPADVARVLSSAGLSVDVDRIARVPSECCGGCGG